MSPLGTFVRGVPFPFFFDHTHTRVLHISQSCSDSSVTTMSSSVPDAAAAAASVDPAPSATESFGMDEVRLSCCFGPLARQAHSWPRLRRDF
jgi:hypothetical protein